MAVGVWDTCDVPEDQHEAKFFVSHIPGGDDKFFTFSTGVGVEPMSQHDNTQLRGHVAIGLVLLETGPQSDEVQREPGQSDFEEHFQVQQPPTWVQWSTHEEIVQVVAGHSVVITGDKQRPQVQHDGESETRDDGTGHDLAEDVDDGVKLEDPGDVQRDDQSGRHVQRPHGVTVVWQLLVL